METILTDDMRRIRDALGSVQDPCHALSDHPLSILDLGLVTDGKSCVQWRKLRALGLEARLDALVVTDDLDTPKPSPEPFRVAAAT